MEDHAFAVEAVGLSKVYKDFWGRQKATGVDRVTFKVKKGEVLGFLGPNGSGKTTTIKLILGLLRPSAGSLKVFESNPHNTFIKNRIGYLPEDNHLYAFLRADETLEFYGSFFSLSRLEKKKRALQLLDMVGLGHAKKRRVGEFSKGMMRRIGLAQALINDPDLIILDEPTSGLDPIGCRDVKTIIRLLAKRNKTVIVCSHLLSDMEEICDNVLIIYRGRIIAEGPLKNLLKEREKTQITTPILDHNSLRKVMAALDEEVSSDEITVTHPRITLENFFLDALNQASPETIDHSSDQPPSRPIAEYLIEEVENSKTSEAILQEWNKEPENLSIESENFNLDEENKMDSSPNHSLLEKLNHKKNK